MLTLWLYTLFPITIILFLVSFYLTVFLYFLTFVTIVSIQSLTLLALLSNTDFTGYLVFLSLHCWGWCVFSVGLIQVPKNFMILWLIVMPSGGPKYKPYTADKK